MDVQEGRLKEAPEKGGNAQNCGGLLHRMLSNLSLNMSVLSLTCQFRPAAQLSLNLSASISLIAFFAWRSQRSCSCEPY